jgi:hypothetical protein
VPDYEDNESVSGTWVAVGLFVLLFLLGVGAAGYTLLRPFLPEDWLP